jgi:hypothetical protein
MELKEAVRHSACEVNVSADAGKLRPSSVATPGSTRRRAARGLLLRNGVWHIEGEASFVSRDAVNPSLAAATRLPCF